MTWFRIHDPYVHVFFLLCVGWRTTWSECKVQLSCIFRLIQSFWCPSVLQICEDRSQSLWSPGARMRYKKTKDMWRRRSYQLDICNIFVDSNNTYTAFNRAVCTRLVSFLRSFLDCQSEGMKDQLLNWYFRGRRHEENCQLNALVLQLTDCSPMCLTESRC